jgi:formylmethanofuran dehydrogenase subunit E
MTKKTETNAKVVDGKYVCPKCEGSKFKLVMHMDCTDSYTDSLSCDNCGEGVFIKRYRDKESRMLWECN